MKYSKLYLKKAARFVLVILFLNMVEITILSAQSFTVGNLNYSVKNDGVSVTVTGHVDGQNATGELIIPASVANEGTTYSVTSIGDEAFYGCRRLTGELTIPNSVTSIGDGAFAFCSRFTGDLTIPSSVTSISDGAFAKCKGLTGELTIPNSVTSIGNSVFSGCSGLTGNLTIPSSVTSIGVSAFNGCSGFIGDLVIPNSVTTIGGSAFEGCSGFTGDLVIPTSVTSINARVFRDCSGLTGDLTIPSSVTSIGDEAFWGCSGLEQILVESGNTVYDSRDNCNAIIHTSTNELILGCKNTVIPNSVTSIGNCAFANCSGLTGELTIPNSVTSIGISSFNGCSGLTGDLTIPSSVTSISDGAFCGCSGFTGDLTIPSSLTTISKGVFSGCSGLTGDLTIPNSVTTIGDYAFYGCSGFTGDLTIPSSVTSIGDETFRGCSGFSGDLTIPNSVTSIGDGAFNFCSGFTGDLVIPNSVTSIGGGAFYYCSGFTGNLVIPNSVTSIGGGAFEGCSGFTGDLTIPSSVTSIGGKAFCRCSGLEQILVESGNTVYDSRDNCNAIIHTSTNELILGCKNTVIPNSVTSIGDYAFFGCSGLTGALIIPNSVTTIGKSAFNGCSGLTGELTIPSSLTTISESVFNGCSGLTGDLTIPSSVTTIGDYAFNDCSGFTSITIPNSVTSIGFYAFKGCDRLSSIFMLSITPPTLASAIFSSSLIYVPYESLGEYKTAAYWIHSQRQIYPWLQKSVVGYEENNDKWVFIASPLVEDADPNTVDNMVTETATDYDLYRFNQSVELEWENYKEQGEHYHFALENGRGYLYANAEDVNLMFKGTFNENETETINLVYDQGKDYAGWNLVGNPFPVNAYANRSYYVMNEDGTAIEPIAISMETAIPPCTGIMVKAEATGQTVTFTKESRQVSNNGNLQIAVVQNSLRSNAFQDKVIVSFNEGDELGKFVFNKDNAKLYIPQGNEDYAIAYAEKTGEMPLNFVVMENGTYTISVNPENVEMEYLHLVDNHTGNDINLLTTPSYTFEAKTSDYVSRFRLVFSVCEDADDDNDDAPFAFISNGEIRLLVETCHGASLQVVDVMGRVQRSTSCTDGACTVSTSNLVPSVYVLRLINGDSVKTQKIVVK